MNTFNVRILYICKFIGQCLPIYAFYTILFIERGLSVTDIASLMALWSIFTIVFEIPSGILADSWNRRNMLAIAAVLQGLCFMLWSVSHTFVMFALGFAFWAIADAFTSGTEEGLTYDNLKSDGCEDTFAEVYSKARFYANLGTITGIASAGILVNYIPIDVISLISAAICFINLIFVLQIREKNYYAEQAAEKPPGFFKILKESVAFIRASRIALISILFLVLFACLGDYLDEFDALIVNDFQLSNIWVSIILVIRFAFTALGDILAPILQKKFSSVKQVFILNGSACFLLLLFAILWDQYAFLLFGPALMFLAITNILLIDTLQNEIKEEGRATVMSFYGIGQNIVMVCFSLVYALLAGIFPLQQAYMIISTYGIAGSLSFYLFFMILYSK